APLFVLSACAGNDEAGNDTSNTVVLAAQGEVPPVDPHRLTGTIGLRISDAIYDTLVRENLTETGDALSDIEPALAEEWTVSDDGMVFEFSIREEISFHDQTPLTAESVKLNFDRFTEEDSPVYSDEAAANMGFIAQWVESTETTSDNTFVVN